MMNDIFVTDRTSIHVFEGDKLVDIYTKETGVPKIHIEEDGVDRDGDLMEVPEFSTGFDRLDNQFDIVMGKEEGEEVNRYNKLISSGIPMSVIDEEVMDKDWARERNRDIEEEVAELRERLTIERKRLDGDERVRSYDYVEHLENRIADLLETRDTLTYDFGLAGEPFDELYRKKKTKGTGGPNYKEAQFRKITNQMLELYLKKNADYGDSFSDSLDEDGLLVSKIRMGDKYKRFGQLIENDAEIDDETMEDTLIDLANYTIMTLMWIREQEDK